MQENEEGNPHRRKAVHWKQLSDDELRDVARKEGLWGLSPSDLGRAYQAYYRYLTKEKPEILKEITKRERGIWKGKSHDELVEYARETGVYGLSSIEFQSKEPGFYRYLRAEEPEVGNEVMVRTNIDWRGMSNKDVIKYAKKGGLVGKSPKELWELDPKYYEEVTRNRPKLKAKLIKKTRGIVDWDKMDNEEMKEHLRNEGLWGKSPSELRKKNGAAYYELVKNRPDVLREATQREVIDWKAKSDEQIREYFSENKLLGKSPKELRQADLAAYTYLSKNRKQMLDELTVRKRAKPKQFRSYPLATKISLVREYYSTEGTVKDTQSKRDISGSMLSQWSHNPAFVLQAFPLGNAFTRASLMEIGISEKKLDKFIEILSKGEIGIYRFGNTYFSKEVLDKLVQIDEGMGGQKGTIGQLWGGLAKTYSGNQVRRVRFEYAYGNGLQTEEVTVQVLERAEENGVVRLEKDKQPAIMKLTVGGLLNRQGMDEVQDAAIVTATIRILEDIVRKTKGIVVDAGCGPTGCVLRAFSEDTTVLGFDKEQSYLDYRQKQDRARGNALYAKADISELAMKAGSAAAVFSTNVLNILDSKRIASAVLEAKRVVEKTGQAYIIVSDSQSAYRISKVIDALEIPHIDTKARVTFSDNEAIYCYVVNFNPNSAEVRSAVTEVLGLDEQRLIIRPEYLNNSPTFRTGKVDVESLKGYLVEETKEGIGIPDNALPFVNRYLDLLELTNGLSNNGVSRVAREFGLKGVYLGSLETKSGEKLYFADSEETFWLTAIARRVPRSNEETAKMRNLERLRNLLRAGELIKKAERRVIKVSQA